MARDRPLIGISEGIDDRIVGAGSERRGNHASGD
jgi:hypothetical protein